jgi:hypothetical protein
MIAETLAKANAYLPVRYTVWGLCIFGALLSLFSMVAFQLGLLFFIAFTALSLLGVRDLRQSKHAILRNYPVTTKPRRFRARSALWCTSAPRASPTNGRLAPSWT